MGSGEDKRRERRVRERGPTWRQDIWTDSVIEFTEEMQSSRKKGLCLTTNRGKTLLFSAYIKKNLRYGQEHLNSVELFFFL